MRYREYAPPAHLAGSVECFWTFDADASQGTHRVLPDACEDIVFLPGSGLLAAVGTMTKAQVYTHAQPQTLVGVRFHPSMARQFLGVAAHELTDGLVDLGSLWGARGEQLRSRLSSAATGEESVARLAEELRPVEETAARRWCCGSPNRAAASGWTIWPGSLDSASGTCGGSSWSRRASRRSYSAGWCGFAV
ncbi:MAG: hypothetical protein QM757_27495 [Paludibaculum sp.]